MLYLAPQGPVLRKRPYVYCFSELALCAVYTEIKQWAGEVEV